MASGIFDECCLVERMAVGCIKLCMWLKVYASHNTSISQQSSGPEGDPPIDGYVHEDGPFVGGISCCLIYWDY
jgi:hypothetical protein